MKKKKKKVGWFIYFFTKKVLNNQLPLYMSLESYNIFVKSLTQSHLTWPVCNPTKFLICNPKKETKIKKE